MFANPGLKRGLHTFRQGVPFPSTLIILFLFDTWISIISSTLSFGYILPIHRERSFPRTNKWKRNYYFVKNKILLKAIKSIRWLRDYIVIHVAYSIVLRKSRYKQFQFISPRVGRKLKSIIAQPYLRRDRSLHPSSPVRFSVFSAFIFPLSKRRLEIASCPMRNPPK